MQSENGKKVLKKITIELKKEIVENHEHDINVTGLTLEYKTEKSTIWKYKDAKGSHGHEVNQAKDMRACNVESFC